MSDLRARAAQAADPQVRDATEEALRNPSAETIEAAVEAAVRARTVELDSSIEASDQSVPAHVAYSRVMGDVQYVAKSDQRQDPGGRYMFRGIDSLLNAVGPALRKHGGMFVPTKVMREHDQVPTGNNRLMQRARVTVTYGFVGPAGDVFPLSIESAGEAFDAGDKATPKAMSVALRTAYIQAFAIPVQQPEMDTERGPQYEVTLPPPPTVAEYLAEIAKPNVTLERLRQIRAEISQHGLSGSPVEEADGNGTTTLVKVLVAKAAKVKGEEI